MRTAVIAAVCDLRFKTSMMMKERMSLVVEMVVEQLDHSDSRINFEELRAAPPKNTEDTPSTTSFEGLYYLLDCLNSILLNDTSLCLVQRRHGRSSLLPFKYAPAVVWSSLR